MSIDWFRRLSTPQRIFVGVTSVVVLTLLTVIVSALLDRGQDASAVTINVWGVDDASTWKPTLANYHDVYKNNKVVYTQVDPENYEFDLISAMAAGTGPDVFMFHNSWLPRHGDKVATAPEDKMSLETFKALFPQVAEKDLTTVGRVIGLPLSVDTLALVYNRDIFDRKGVVSPPETWEEFSSHISKLRELEGDSLDLAGASIGGTSRNIPNSVDILSLLMMQNGSPMTDPNLNSARLLNEGGQDALAFYAGFGSPNNPLFTWDDRQKSTLEAFEKSEVAMIFAYSHELEEVRRGNPFLDFDVVPMLQLNADAPVNYADYWALAVNSKTDIRSEAWDFVIFAATDEQTARNYFDSTARPPALRTLIGTYLRNPKAGVFAQQALTADSWWRADEDKIREIFDTMIRDVASGNRLALQALSTANTALTQLMRR